MAVKLYRLINASTSRKGRAAWRLAEVMYPASLPVNPVTPDELQAAVWKHLEEEAWFPPVVAFEWHDGNLYLVQHPRNNSTVNQVLTAWRKVSRV
jgi:hypothetical protein